VSVLVPSDPADVGGDREVGDLMLDPLEDVVIGLEEIKYRGHQIVVPGARGHLQQCSCCPKQIGVLGWYRYEGPVGVGGVVIGQSRAKHTGLLLQVGVSLCQYIQ
jgi:hypothetical protein